MGKGKNVCEMCDHKHSGDCDDCNACGHDKHCGYGMCCGAHGHKSCWRWFFKLIVAVVILTLVFSVGMFAGAAKVLRSGYNGTDFLGSSGMMGLRGMMNSDWSWMMGGGWKEGQARAFGTVDSVEGNRITFTDNGEKTGVIISAATTSIVSGNNLAPLNAIKAGQTISAYGTVNQANEFEATWIVIQ